MLTTPSFKSRKELAPPLFGVALGYLGGLVLFIGALAAVVSFGGFSGAFFLSGSAGYAFVSLGFVTSILTFLSSSMLYNRPEEHHVWGWIILFFGIIGLGPWNFFGVYAVGSVLSIAGGFYGMMFQPYEVSVPTVVMDYGASNVRAVYGWILPWSTSL